MFKYVADISVIAHNIIEDFLEEKVVAIDGTLGNGHDTDFLAKNFKKVYAFDIQEEPCKKYKEKGIENVQVIHDSHDKFNEYINEGVNCIMYNLGFLPGGDKEITTQHETSLKSIQDGLEILMPGGIMAICIYRGHNEGKKEETCILEYLQSLNKARYGVMLHSYLNRTNNPPLLVIVEKK